MANTLYKLLFLLIPFLLSCSKSNETTLRNNLGINPADCNTNNIKFSTDITPILQANCTFCHNNVTANSGVNTQTYNGVKLIVDNGLLIGTITHASGFIPMPLGSSKLSDCNIAKIKAWIAQGSKND